MFKNILVPLDGSSLAEAALPYAKAVARRAHAALTLVRAARNASPLGDVTYDQQHHTLEQADDYLKLLADALIGQGFSVQTGVPYGGSAAEWIVDETQIRKAELIVMATHDRVGLDRWVHGSVAEKVVHQSTVPVMLVGTESADELAQRWLTPRPTLAVPLDGSELAEAALPLVRTLVQTLDARVVLVGVVPRAGQLVAGQGGAIVTYVGSELDELEARASAYLQATMGRIGGSQTTVETVLRHGDAATEIAAVAQEYAAAAVIMATHGRTGLVRSILGSVAGGVLHRSCAPVVLVRPSALRRAEEPLAEKTTATSPA